MKIELKHIEKKFPDATPLKDVNAQINDGDIIAIIGPSGTGKSTLMRCINMLDPPTGGQVIIDGVDITASKENFEKMRLKMGMVFQSFNLFNHLTAIENIMLPLTSIKKLSRQEAYNIAIEELKKVGLEKKALKYPSELSGGQKQRVSIARTLAMDTELILLDEPTSALDPTMVREVESVICNLAKTGKTMMIVTHEMRLAKAISNRVFYLDQGILYEEGTPDQIFEHPTRERTKAFINHLKVFKYRFETSNFDYEEFMGSFVDFVKHNNIETNTKFVLQSSIEYIVTEFVPKYIKESIVVSILSEFNPETNTAKFLVYTSMHDISDLTNGLKKYFNTIKVEEIEDKDFINKISCEI